MSLIYSAKFFFSKTTKLNPFFSKPKPANIPKVIYPKQHPVKLDSEDTQIISIGEPKFYLSPHNEVKHDLYRPKDYDYFESPQHALSLDICLLGAPNAGKSSLMNKIVGHYVSAVSDKSNTTDDKVVGIRTNVEKLTQIVLNDTPGITKVYKNTDNFITKAWEVVSECDKVLLVVDSVKRLDDSLKEVIKRLKNMKLDEKTRDQIKKLKSMAAGPDFDPKLLRDEEEDTEESKLKYKYGDTTIPTYLILNKIDLCTNKKKLKWLLNELEDLFRFEKVFYISVETGYGIEDLIKTLEEEAYEKPWTYNPEIVTDMSEVERIEELMKAQVYQRFYYELPFKIGIKLSGT